MLLRLQYNIRKKHSISLLANPIVCILLLEITTAKGTV